MPPRKASGMARKLMPVCWVHKPGGAEHTPLGCLIMIRRNKATTKQVIDLAPMSLRLGNMFQSEARTEPCIRLSSLH